MRSPLRWLLLLGGLFALPAFGQSTPPPDPKAALSPEDQEVVENLELLEHLPESRELDTMIELAKVQDSDGESGEQAGDEGETGGQ